MTQKWSETLKQIDAVQWEIPKAGNMHVPGRIFASAALLEDIFRDEALAQVVHVAQLPGIVGCALAMPDIHWGYGFPIGGVAAFDPDHGIVSPGGVGYDINCGVRCIRTGLSVEEIRSKRDDLIRVLAAQVPAGVGNEGRIRLSRHQLGQVLEKGGAWAIKAGYGWSSDLDCTEDKGCMPDAESKSVSERACERGLAQMGTLGSGNHFIEVQQVDAIYDEKIAAAYGLFAGQVTVMIHCGSRGLGYQVCDDHVRELRQASVHYRIALPDKQLACAPIASPEGRAYWRGMAAAANYAWANRQCITHWVREAFEQVFRKSAEQMKMHVLYDVAHNIAKLETHQVDGRSKIVCVHRKGATRAFAAGHVDVPQVYQSVGQPVFIPGTMGTASYICAGMPNAMALTFGSTAHGAGRVLSRSAALRKTRGRSVASELSDRGIVVVARNKATLGEEVPEAYKAVDEVVESAQRAGLSGKVARLIPLGVVKG